MRRAVGLALLLVCSAIGGAAVTANAADVAIRSVNTSVDEPAPGEPFTLSVNLSNLGNDTVDVTDVYVRGAGGDEYGRVGNLGSVAPGGTLTVPVSVRIDDAGRTRLSVYAVVEDADGDTTRVRHPVYVNVEEPDETAVSFSGLDPVAGDEATVDVTVANGDSGALSNVRLELGGDARVADPERLNASLAPGRQVTYTYEVTFPDAGEATLDATVSYKTDDGTTRTVSYERTTDVEAADSDVDVTATGTEINGSPAIRTAVTQYGNVDLTDVQVRAVVDGGTVARTLAPDVPAGETRTVTLDGTSVPAGEVTVVAEYAAAGDERTTNATIDYSPREASNVDLTGVEATRAGSTITLSGDAANLGSADADSVLLSVADTEGVSPASPNGEYFVGTIESSEFATFELTASTNAAANTTLESVPVEVSYSANGERVTRTVEVDVSGPSAAAVGGATGVGGASGADAGGAGASAGSGGSGGLPLVAIGIVLLLVVAVAGIGVYRWRSQ